MIVAGLLLAVLCVVKLIAHGINAALWWKKKKFKVSRTMIMTMKTKKKKLSIYDTKFNGKVFFEYNGETREVYWVWYKLTYCLIESKEGILLVHRITNRVEEFSSVNMLPDKYQKFKDWRRIPAKMREFLEQGKVQVAE